jgi:hypothetical protein
MCFNSRLERYFCSSDSMIYVNAVEIGAGRGG